MGNIRLKSLDALRGLAVVLMIIVNNPGNHRYTITQLKHATWHGCTLADLVFPFFLYVMGVAMAFSMFSENQTFKTKVYFKILKRTIILIGLGLFAHSLPDFDLANIRIPGILQRIGICYFVASMILLHTNKRGRIVSIFFLLSLYCILMVLYPFPGKGPDSWAQDANFAQYLDNRVFNQHTLKPGMDPEGMLSTLPAIVTVLLGNLSGKWIKKAKTNNSQKLKEHYLASFLLITLALILNPILPMNKQLWTPTFVFFTGGIAMFLFIFFYWLIDLKGYKKLAFPLELFGLNALVLFFSSVLGTKVMRFIKVPYGGEETTLKAYLISQLDHLSGPYTASILFTILYVLLVYLFAWILYNKKILIKI